ncbi:hypothetical protein V5799_014414 [Amblyomma americanum]|uniref:Uncharacterized protein n=1 Tax=Amblyomma americanum TaxID=6943 RepID=A0AAQ4E339_AMBAM
MDAIFPAIALTLVALVSPGSAANSSVLCTTNKDCTGGKVCVPHYNYTSGSNCNTQSYCINVSGDTCSCRDGYACRPKDCPKSPYECLILENHETRCGGKRAPVCKEGEVCAYVFQNIYCYECPCYYTHEVSCVKITKQHRACGPKSIAEISGHRKYSCDGCKSATAVLTPPTISPGP